ncbi:MoxR family ATPase [Candidatus Sumerlaeota bacterium]|nr:MoxR family ATPase [Candidatus Sumerlaeota bacterium]
MAKIRNEKLRLLKQNIERIIKGKSDVIDLAIIGILAQGHILIEDVPGVGKTTLAYLLARSIDCSFQRIQFTSDLLPSDILGVTIYSQRTQEFVFKEGPIFANIVLADEINRTTPKTQSSLLEAMNTAQVSIDKVTYQLPQPFMVIATQNPIEFHGTFPLPKSQLDRFLMRIHIGYPDKADEVTILREQKFPGIPEEVEPVLHKDEVIEMQKEVANVRIDEDLLHYIAEIVTATRNSPLIELGVSPRGALALRRCAQAKAFLEGRNYVVPDDIKSMAVSALAHRIQVAQTFETTSLTHHDDEHIIRQLLEQVEVPI